MFGIYFLLVFFLNSCGGGVQNAHDICISGQVLDVFEDGCPFAHVALYRSGNLEQVTETDLDGFFNLCVKEPGSYDLEFHYVGMISQQANNVSVSSEGIDDLTFYLLKDSSCPDLEVTEPYIPLVNSININQQKVNRGIIQGRVTNNNNDALGPSIVQLILDDQVLQCDTVHNYGQYSFSFLAENNYLLKATSAGYNSQIINVFLPENRIVRASFKLNKSIDGKDRVQCIPSKPIIIQVD